MLSPAPARVARGRLRRQLQRLVYRDASKAAGVGLALVLLPLVYLFREWPPWLIRSTLHGLPPLPRAELLAAAHGVYGLATAALVRRLLASERLRWWWALPLPAHFWRALHLRHLVLLDLPWLLAIAYGVLPHAQQHGAHVALAEGLTFAGITLAGQIAVASVSDRSRAATLAAGGLWAATAFAAVVLPWWAATALGLGSLGLAIRRLGWPLPEPRARLRGRAGGHPTIALARLGWLAAHRSNPVAVGWGVGVQLGAVGLVGLAIAHVGVAEPDSVLALRRGLAVAAAVVGAALILRAARAIDGDHPHLDAWGIDPRHLRHAWLLLGAAGSLPAILLGTAVLATTGTLGLGWIADLALALAWASVDQLALVYRLHAQRRLHEPRLPRMLLRTAAALLLVGLAGTILALLPWAAVQALRLPALQRRADRARLRFETALRDDHQA